MPPLEWMSSPAFRKDIEETVKDAAARQGMRQYEVQIVTLFQEYLDENRPRRLNEELKKVTAAQRTKDDALSSVRLVVTEASRLAFAEHRTIVTAADLRKAYAANYCRIWPFC